eukprot:2519749-Alexandrium_andersonii.AAC.1
MIVRWEVGRWRCELPGFGQFTQPPPFHCHGSLDVSAALRYRGCRYCARGRARVCVMALGMPSSPLPFWGGRRRSAMM